MSEPIQIWITRFPLSKSGGIEAEQGFPHPLDPESIIVATGRFKGMTLSGDHWHRTEEKARKYCEAYRKNLIRQKRDELEELETMQPFTE